MILGGRLFVLVILFSASAISETNLKVRKGKHFFTLLGYLREYKFGQTYALDVPPFFLSPVIIVPTIHQHQSVNIDESVAGDYFSEHHEPAKIVSCKSNSSEDIEVTQKPVQTVEPTHNVNASFRFVDNTTHSNLQFEKLTTTTASSAMTNTAKEELTIRTTQSNILHVNVTTRQPELNTSNSTILITSTTEIENVTEPSNGTTVTSPSSNLTNYGPYPAALYNNIVIDQLSITTDSYTNEESRLPPPQDDRWHSFSSLQNKIYTSNGFKPLAGLYYDGFWHKPIQKTPFVPGYNNLFFK